MLKKLAYLKHLLFAYAFAYFSKYAVKLLLSTCKIEVHGFEAFIKYAAENKCILMLWHNRLALVAEIMHAHAPQFIYNALISNSRDGDPLAILVQSYQSGKTIRVRHNGRHHALKQAIDSLKKSHEIIVVTPDGPKGPCYQVKPGAAWVAKETNAAVFPFSWKANRFWQLGTWDKMMFPKPFSKIEVIIGAPIFPEKHVFNLNQMVETLETSLNSLSGHAIFF